MSLAEVLDCGFEIEGWQDEVDWFAWLKDKLSRVGSGEQ